MREIIVIRRVVSVRKIRIPVFPVVIIGIFIICFIIGKFIASGNNKKPEQRDSVLQPDENLITSVSSSPKKIKKPEFIEKIETQNTDERIPANENTPPDRMMYPCGQKILNDYSQKAGYSKTMKDWRTHTGVDYEADIGENVFSVWDGTVQKVYKDMLWGYTVEILHDGNIISKYKNLDSAILINEGDPVKGGQAIGKIGNSAIIEIKERPHLHFELWTGGEPINPNSYIY